MVAVVFEAGSGTYMQCRKGVVKSLYDISA
jgi:hypothetical protein